MNIKTHNDELKNLVRSVGVRMVRNLVVELFTMLNLFVMFAVVVFHLSEINTAFVYSIPYVIVLIGFSVSNCISIVRQLLENKVFSTNKEDIQAIIDAESKSGLRDGLLVHSIFKNREQAKKIKALSSKLDIVKAVGGIQHRGTAKIFFVISTMLFIYTILNIAFLQYYTWNPDIVFDQLSYFLMLKWTLFIVMGVMGIFAGILYKMIWGLKDINICSTCRRIEWESEWYTLENFIGRPSHDICPICTDAFVRDIEKKVNKVIDLSEKKED